MKEIKVSFNNCTYENIKRIEVFILFIGIMGAFPLGIVGITNIFSQKDNGFIELAIAAILLLLTFLAFAICCGIGELVKNSYLQRKLTEAKFLDEGYKLKEPEPEKIYNDV